MRLFQEIFLSLAAPANCATGNNNRGMGEGGGVGESLLSGKTLAANRGGIAGGGCNGVSRVGLCLPLLTRRFAKFLSCVAKVFPAYSAQIVYVFISRAHLCP